MLLMKKMKVAVFPAGTEIGLEIHNALRFVKDIDLFGFSSADDHSSLVYKNIVTDFPFLGDSGLLSHLASEIKRNNIDYIFPAHDDATVFLALNQDQLSATVVSPDVSTSNVCRSKSLTYEQLSGCSFTPKTFDFHEINDLDFPLFIKPDRGQGSVGANVIKTKEQLLRVPSISDYVICEYFSGDEYTVDCLTDSSGDLLVSMHRKRSRVKAGISVASRNLPQSDEIKAIAEIISNKLEMRGAWFFQLKENDDGELKLLEVAARIAGTMGMYRNVGVNFPLLSLYIAKNTDVSIIENTIDLSVDRAFISRYQSNLSYQVVYMDFDDTIIIDDKINTLLIQFVYQCQNNNIGVILITRHLNIVEDTLDKLKIHKKLFQKIIHLKNGEQKSDFIANKNAIFVDDSFSERADVFSQCSIPVFDIDSVELLLDWRR